MREVLLTALQQTLYIPFPLTLVGRFLRHLSGCRFDADRSGRTEAEQDSVRNFRFFRQRLSQFSVCHSHDSCHSLDPSADRSGDRYGGGRCAADDQRDSVYGAYL